MTLSGTMTASGLNTEFSTPNILNSLTGTDHAGFTRLGKPFSVVLQINNIATGLNVGLRSVSFVAEDDFYIAALVINHKDNTAGNVISATLKVVNPANNDEAGLDDYRLFDVYSNLAWAPSIALASIIGRTTGRNTITGTYKKYLVRGVGYQLIVDGPVIATVSTTTVQLMCYQKRRVNT